MSLHPSIAAVRNAVRETLAEREPGDRVIVACSGGPDSMALLSATVFEGRKLGLVIVGATVDHGLQERSGEHALHVVAQMAALGVDETFLATVTVESEGLGMEGAARRARYAVFDNAPESLDAAVVLLGHTRDDQAETVLLGLARGSGGRSIAGMRRAYRHYRRPLLDVARADTVTACQVEGIDYWTDPHNHDPSFARVRVRHFVLPVLEERLGPGVAAALARTADQLRADTDYLDELAEPAFTTEVEGLAALPVPIRRRVLRLAALRAGAYPGELTYDHVMALDALVTRWHGQQFIELPGHVRARRDQGRILFETTPR